jgi:predicted ArsR family transcriptional regulator
VAERGAPVVDGVEAIRAEAARLGFDPLVRQRKTTTEVVLRHCPFSIVAATDPGVVCELHLGLAEGIAAASGDVRVTGLRRADPHTAGCRVLLERSAPADP